MDSAEDILMVISPFSTNLWSSSCLGETFLVVLDILKAFDTSCHNSLDANIAKIVGVHFVLKLIELDLK